MERRSKRSEECNVEAVIPCYQCGKTLTSHYLCKWDGPRNIEIVELSCICGFSYSAKGTYGTTNIPFGQF